MHHSELPTLKRHWLLLTGLALCNCSSSTTDNSTEMGALPTSASQEVDRFFDEIVNATCDRGKRCETRGITSAEGCPAYVRTFIASTLDSRRVTLNETHAQDCVEGYQKADCDSNSVPTACEDAFSGLTPVGGDCFLSDHCADGLFCDTSDQCPGTCAERLGLGESCVARGCQEGLSCLSEVCITTAALGEACELGGCEADALCYEGVCARPDEVFATSAAGEPCDQTTSACAANTFCSDSVCTPVTVGQPCSGDASCGLFGANTVGDFYCAEDATCQPAQADGQPCTEPTHCDSLLCTNETCGYGQLVGEACSKNEECLTENCEQGRCAVPPPTCN